MDTAQRYTMAATVLMTSNCTALVLLRRSADDKLVRKRVKRRRELFAVLPGCGLLRNV